jgi:hypothetical protein
MQSSVDAVISLAEKALGPSMLGWGGDDYASRIFFIEAAAGDRSAFGQTLLSLAWTLDSHVERYDSGVVPSILRALFPK